MAHPHWLNISALLASGEFKKHNWAILRAEAATANTFLNYYDEQGRYIHYYPATEEQYEVSLTEPRTRRLLPPEEAVSE